MGKTSLFTLFNKHEVYKNAEPTLGLVIEIKSMVAGQNHVTLKVNAHVFYLTP